MWLEEVGGQATVVFYMFLGQHRAARCNSPNDGNTRILGQSNPTGSASDHFNSALTREGLEVFLSSVGGFETEFSRNVGPGRRIARVINVLADDVQHLLLPLRKLFHYGHPLSIYTDAVIIYSIGCN